MKKHGRPTKQKAGLKAQCKDLAPKNSTMWCRYCKGTWEAKGCKPSKAIQEFYSNAAHTLPIFGSPPPEPESKASFKSGEIKQRALDKVGCFHHKPCPRSAATRNAKKANTDLHHGRVCPIIRGCKAVYFWTRPGSLKPGLPTGSWRNRRTYCRKPWTHKKKTNSILQSTIPAR